MKEKISIRLSAELPASVDGLIDGKSSRSAFIESILREYIETRARTAFPTLDLQRINKAADGLNSEVIDVAGYQPGRKRTLSKLYYPERFGEGCCAMFQTRLHS